MYSIKTVDKEGITRYKNKKGQYHREDGPAFESPDGTKTWFINGLYHREDGPAVEFVDGEGWYYLNGKEYTKEDWEKEIIKIKLERIKDL